VHSQPLAASPWCQTASWSGGAGLSCFAALGGGSHVVVGAPGREVLVYDVATQQPVCSAKAPAKDWLGMYVQIVCASAAFLQDAGHHSTLLVGGDHQLRLFDFRAQRRAVRTMALGDKGLVTALAVQRGGAQAVGGTSRGQLAQFDLASGRCIGALKVRGGEGSAIARRASHLCHPGPPSLCQGCTGAVRSLSQHPTLPLLAATGARNPTRFVRCAMQQPG